MKRLVTVFALLIAIGVIAFAYTGAPTGIWEGLGKNTEKQAYNPASAGMDAKKVLPVWMYPEIDDGQVFEKTLDSDGVTVHNGGSVSWQTAGVDTAPVGLKSDDNPGDMKGSKFMYATAVYNIALESDQMASVDYTFSGLPKGDYQINLSVPSNLTINDDYYAVCNYAYVRIKINGEQPFNSVVDMSREAYSGRWIYATAETINLPDTANTVTVTITNIGDYLEEDSLSEDTVPAIVLADAVRIIKLSTAQMVGSPVAERAGAGSVIVDDSELIYDGSAWRKLDILHAPYLAEGQMALGNSYSYLPKNARNGANNARLPFSVGATGDYRLKIHCPQTDGVLEGDYIVNTLGSASTYSFSVVDDTDTVLSNFTGTTGPQGWLTLSSNSLYSFSAGRVYYLEINAGQGTLTDGMTFDALKVERVNEADGGVYPGNGFPIVYTSINEADEGVDSANPAHWQGRLCAVNATGDDENKVATDLWTYPNKDTDKWGLYEGPVPGGFATTPLVTSALDPRTGRLEKVLFVGDKSGIFYAFDASGADYASGNATGSRLLFKGPGLFINEVPVAADRQTAAPGLAFGSSYTRLDTGASSMDYNITSKDRAACGDVDVVDEYKVVASGFNYRIKMFVPNLPDTVGSRFDVIVEYGLGGSKEIKTIADQEIKTSDLGCWKSVDGGSHFARPTRVTLKYKSGGFIAADQIWLYPSTVPGEDPAFGDAAPIANVNKAAAGTPADELGCATQVYATTANGRTWTYELSHMWNDDAKCIGRLVWARPALADAAPDGGATPLYADGSLFTFTQSAATHGSWKLTRYSWLDTREFSNEGGYVDAEDLGVFEGGDGPKAISGFKGSDGKWYVAVPTGKADDKQLAVCSWK
ncbi:MAG: hypothetical protein J5758_07310, partial [Abditibacteriota bacterium]|nr:hypothetical protein [Abditibacteriota bacterium]